jgi:ketosteroid isomerase-like protein
MTATETQQAGPGLGETYRRSVQWWAQQAAAVTDDQWALPTPCSDWSVRDLVNHVVGEDLWTSPLMRGRTIADVGSRLDGDLLGEDPRGAAASAATEALGVVEETLPAHGTVQLSYGEESMDEYVRQLVADVAAWFDGTEDAYRSRGAVGPRMPSGGDPQGDLLARFGRDATWGPAHAGFTAFIAAFGRGDVDAIMALMTDDCVFEATGPAPDGLRHEGAADVRSVWESLFTETGSPAFTAEESFVAGDRGVLRWRFDWVAPDGSPGHVRGVDVVRLRDGKVCEKLSYVKG